MGLFQLSKAAKNDLRSIAIFTGNRWGKAQRNLYIKQLDDAFLLLAQNPEAGSSCDEIREGYRKYLQGSHVIFYKRTSPSEILVVRILHKRMDYTSHT